MPRVRSPRPLLDNLDDPATDQRPLAPVAEAAPISIADLGTPAIPSTLAPQQPSSYNYPDESQRALNAGSLAVNASANARATATATPAPVQPLPPPPPPIPPVTPGPISTPTPVAGLRTAPTPLPEPMPTGAGEQNTPVNYGATVQDVGYRLSTALPPQSTIDEGPPNYQRLAAPQEQPQTVGVPPTTINPMQQAQGAATGQPVAAPAGLQKPFVGDFRITTTFGEQDPGLWKNPGGHPGIDYGTPVGTPVLAAAGGTVSAVGLDGNYGQRVVIRHPNGEETIYGHLLSANVQSGTQVAPGQPIGRSGGMPGTPGAGLSTGPHLHFEVRQNGQPVDPSTFFGPGQAQQPVSPGGGPTEQMPHPANAWPTNMDAHRADSRAKAEAAARAAGIDPNIFAAQMARETGNYDPDIMSGARRSSAGAAGPAQLMPIHWKAVRSAQNAAQPGNPLNPDDAYKYAAGLMAGFLKQYDGDWPKALAAYNAGPGAVKQYGGVPPFGETQTYVRDILSQAPRQQEAPAAPPAGPPTPANAPASSPERTRQVASGFAWTLAQREATQRINDQKTALQNLINSGQMTVEQAQAHMDFVLKREDDYLMTRPLGGATSSHQTLTNIPEDYEQPTVQYRGRYGGHEEPGPEALSAEERAAAVNEEFAQKYPDLAALQAEQANQPRLNPLAPEIGHLGGEIIGSLPIVPAAEARMFGVNQVPTVKESLTSLSENVKQPFQGLIDLSASQSGMSADGEVPQGQGTVQQAQEANRQRQQMYQAVRQGTLPYDYLKARYASMPEAAKQMLPSNLLLDPGNLAAGVASEGLAPAIGLGMALTRLPGELRDLNQAVGLAREMAAAHAATPLSPLIGPAGDAAAVGLASRLGQAASMVRSTAVELNQIKQLLPLYRTMQRERAAASGIAQLTERAGQGFNPQAGARVRPLADILRETGGPITPAEEAELAAQATRSEAQARQEAGAATQALEGVIDLPGAIALGGRTVREGAGDAAPLQQRANLARRIIDAVARAGTAAGFSGPGTTTPTPPGYRSVTLGMSLGAPPPGERPGQQPLSEMQQAGQVLGNLPGAQVIQNPTGSWSFVGKVPDQLAFTTREGDVPTAEQIQAAKQHGPGIVGLRTRSWPTQEEALAAAAAIQPTPAPAVGAPRQPETIEFVRQSLRPGSQPENFTLPSGTPGTAAAGGQPNVTIRDRQTVELPFTISVGNRRTETPSTHSGVRTVGDTYVILNVGDTGEPWYIVNRSGQVERNATFRTQQAATDEAVLRLQRQTPAAEPGAAAAAGVLPDYSPAREYAQGLTGNARKDFAERYLRWVEQGRPGGAPRPAKVVFQSTAREIREKIDSLTKGLAAEPQPAAQQQPSVEELGNAGTTAGAGAEPGLSAAQPGASAGAGPDRYAGAAPAGVQEAGPGAATQPAAAAEGGGVPQTGRKSPEQRDVDRTGLGGGDPAGPVGAAGRLAQVSPPSPSGAHDLQMDAAEIARVAVASPVVRADANLDALDTLVSLYRDGRAGRSTPAEQLALSLFSGWGDSGFNPMFPRDDFMRQRQDREWQEREQRLLRLAEELKTYLGEDVARALARSRLNAHYTPPHIVDAMYGIASWLGIHNLNQIRMLEPAAGSGRFVGLMPVELAARSERTLVELDKATGAMLRELFPNSTVYGGVGYEQAPIADNSQDLIITNVPFGDYGMSDPALRKRGAFSNLSIHNQFLVKNNDKLRPGGVQIVITSHHTMDAPTMTRFRAQLSESADLIGAIRLPEKAFRDTDVATDILVLQKRAPGQQPNGIPWADTQTLSLPAGPRNAVRSYEQYNVDQSVNQYFIDHPEMALGEHSSRGSMNAKDLYTLEARPGENLQTALMQAIGKLEPNILTDQPHIDDEPRTGSRDMTGAKEGSWVVQDGELLQKEQGLLVRREITPEQDTRIRAMLEVRDAARRLHAAELGASTDAELAPLREELNRSYDNFYGMFGPLNLKANTDLMRLDPDGPWLRGLEKWSKERGAEYRKKGFAPGPAHRDAIKADFFRRRVSKGEDADRRIASPTDALLVALNDVGRLDFEYMGSLLGRPGVEVRNDLARSGLIFRNPTGGWETADQYLSGDVRGKLRAAGLAAQQNEAYRANVEALTVVQPPDLPPSQIPVKLGAHWIPASDVNAFVREITGYFRRGGEFFRYVAQSGRWIQEVAPWFNDFDRGLMEDKWGTPRMSALEIVADLLNNKTIEVTERVDGKPVVLAKPTEAARAKAEEVQREFAQWVWRDPERSARLSRYYNDNFNNIRNVEADGSHLTLLGMAPEWATKARSLQLGAIWRGIRDGVVGVYHGVGFGKTLTIVAMGMEMKRLGLSPKNLYVVPKITHAQFREQFRQYYPNANVLFPEEDDFAGANLPVYQSRIAANDWDAVILSDSQFDRLPFSEQMQARFVQEELDELEGALRQMEETGGENIKKSPSYKEIQKALVRAEKQMKDLQHALESREVARTLTFDQLGVSMMFVDEAHRYKNLRFRSSLEGVKGLGTAVNGKGAQRAWKMYQASRHMQDTHGGRGVVFATGTPVTNTLAEVWTMMRFLQHRQLVERGLEHFDAWMDTYGRATADWEQTVQGTYKVTNRLREVVGLPELSRLWQLTADIRTPVETPVLTDLQPRVIEDSPGARTVIRAEPDELYKDYLKDIIRRVAALDPRRPDLDNMLSITTDGRKASIDMRLVNPRAPVNPQGKLAKLVETLVDVYHQEAADKGAQAVFLDMGVPKASDKDDPVESAEDVEMEESAEEKATSRSLYAWIKDMLVQQGIPAEEIAFIQEANTPGKRVALLEKFNRGDLRFLLGTTASMSMGLNIQERLAAMHMLSPDWTPDMLRQKEGRGIRPGNVVYGPTVDDDGKVLDKGRGIKIFRYVTQGADDVNSFDAYGWGLLDTKARSFDAAVRRDVTVRSVEDISAGALGADVAVSIATNNPDYLTLQKLTAELLKLSFVKSAHNDAVIHARQEVARLPGQIQEREDDITHYQQDLTHLQANSPKGQPAGLTVGGQTFDKREDAGKALIATLPATMMSGQVTAPVAVYRGFQVQWKHLPPLGTLRKDAYQLILTGPSGKQYETNSVERAELNASGIFARLDTPLNNIEGNITYSREQNARQARELETYKKQAVAESPVDARLARLEAERERLQRKISGAEVEELPPEEAQVPPTGVEEAAPEILSVEPGPESQPLPPPAPAYTDEQLDSLGTGGNAPTMGVTEPGGEAAAPELEPEQVQQPPTLTAEEPPAPPPAEPQVAPTLAGGVPAEPSPITPEAEALLEKVADGGVPAIITRRIVKIAEDNGIAVNDKTTPNEIVQGLEAKVREQLPKSEAAAPAPVQPAPAEMEPSLPVESPVAAAVRAAGAPPAPPQEPPGGGPPTATAAAPEPEPRGLGSRPDLEDQFVALWQNHERGSFEKMRALFDNEMRPFGYTDDDFSALNDRASAERQEREAQAPAAPPALPAAEPQPVEIQNLLRQDAQDLQQQAEEAMAAEAETGSGAEGTEAIPLGPEGSTGGPAGTGAAGVGQPGQEYTFAAHVRTSAGTDSDLADLLDKLRIIRPEAVRSTEAALAAARQRILADPKGGDGVYASIMGTRAQDITEDDIFDGLVLIDYMASQQSVLRAASDLAGADDLLTKARDLTGKLAVKGLHAGREVQAFSGWERLSPVTQLMSYTRTLMNAAGKYDPRTGKYEHQERVAGHLAEIAEQQAKEQYEGKLQHANDEIARMQKEIDDLNEQAANAKKGAQQTARGQKGGGKAAKAETKASTRMRKTLAGKLEYLIKQGRAPGRLPPLPDEDMRVFNRMMTLAQETGWLMPLREGLDLVQEAEDIAKMPKEFRGPAIQALAERMRAPGGYLETLEERAQDFRHIGRVEKAINYAANRGRLPGKPSPLMEGEQVILREFTKTADEVGYVMGPAQQQAFLDAVDTLEKMPDSPMRDQAYRDLVRTIGDTYLPSLYAERDRLREERKAAEQRAANLKYLIDTAERETKPRLKKDYQEAVTVARANAKAGKIDIPVALAQAFLDRADLVKKLPEGSPERYLGWKQLMADAAAIVPHNRLLAALNLFNLPRMLMTMWDFSAALNQGRIQALAHPVRWAQAWMPMVQSFADARFAAELDAKIHTSPNFPYYQKMDLRIIPRNPESHLLDSEDQWIGRAGLPDKNTVMRFVGSAAWEDAYVGMLNALRTSLADDYLEKLQRNGNMLSDKELRDLGHLLNASTGYGNLPDALKTVSFIGSHILFSSRAKVAMFERPLQMARAGLSFVPGAQYVAPNHTYSYRVAWEVGKTYAAYYTLIAAALAGLAAAGASVQLEPTATDFMQVKVGPLRWSPLGEEATLLRTLARLHAGGYRTSTGSFQHQTTAEVIGSYFQGQLHPFAGFALDEAMKVDAIGRQVGLGQPAPSGGLIAGMEQGTRLAARAISPLYRATGQLNDNEVLSGIPLRQWLGPAGAFTEAALSHLIPMVAQSFVQGVGDNLGAAWNTLNVEGNFVGMRINAQQTLMDVRNDMARSLYPNDPKVQRQGYAGVNVGDQREIDAMPTVVEKIAEQYGPESGRVPDIEQTSIQAGVLYRSGEQRLSTATEGVLHTLQYFPDMAKEIKAFKDARYKLAQDTIASPEVQQYRQENKAIPDLRIEDVLAEKYWSAQPGLTPDGAMDWKARDTLRQQTLDEARTMGVDLKYITGDGPKTYRGDRFKEYPLLQKYVRSYENLQEMVKPIFEERDRILQTTPVFQQLIDQADAARRSGNQRLSDALWNSNALHSYLDLLKVYRLNHPEAQRAGELLGYIKPILPTDLSVGSAPVPAGRP